MKRVAEDRCIRIGRKQKILIKLVELIRVGKRIPAEYEIRKRGKTVAWAHNAIEAIEWAMKEDV